MSLTKLPHNELWKKWTAAIEEFAFDPSKSNERLIERIEDEIARRMQEASRRPLRVEG